MDELCRDCGVCCLKTEMILFDSDLELIINNYHEELKVDQFAHKNDDGIYQLDNIEDNCVFFDNRLKSCKIYEFRPKGCVFYPLIFDIEENRCIIDDECPRPNLFYQDKKVYKKISIKVKKYLDTWLDLKK